MRLRCASEVPLDDGRVVYRVEVLFEPEEAREVMSRKDLFAGEGIPLDPSVDFDGVPVFFDAPLQIAGMVIADEDTAARFTCAPEQYEPTVRAVDAYLRDRLQCIWSSRAEP